MPEVIGITRNFSSIAQTSRRTPPHKTIMPLFSKQEKWHFSDLYATSVANSILYGIAPSHLSDHCSAYTPRPPDFSSHYDSQNFRYHLDIDLLIPAGQSCLSIGENVNIRELVKNPGLHTNLFRRDLFPRVPKAF